VPVIYGAIDGSGDLKKDAIFLSVCSCRSGYVRMVCRVCMVCVGCVFVHEQILQLDTEGRLKKKTTR